MSLLPASLKTHRVSSASADAVVHGTVHYAPLKSLWLSTMACAAMIGGVATASWVALSVFLVSTGIVLLLGHSLGSHRKLIHNSFQCPRWLEYALVYLGVQVGLSGPLGLLRQHELRDYAQRLPDCHPYLKHGSTFWRDAWWQLHCELRLDNPPDITLEPHIAEDRFYRFLERTWMWQQLPPALVLYLAGGWSFVFWGTCVRVTAGVVGHWLVGYFAHNHGPMHHEVDAAAVQGHNVPLTSLLTMGEGWHNNHHAFPGSARLGLYAGEWDPGWWALCLLRRAGLVWALRGPADLPHRPELRRSNPAARCLAGPPSSVSIGRLRDLPALLVAWHSIRRHAGWLTGPAATLPEPLLARLAGGRFQRAPESDRLFFSTPDTTVRGLAALCLAVSARGRVAGAIGLLALPIAAAAESVRHVCTDAR
ncbi:acyl-CoA desaturase [Caldimonas brevitalea]|uniref:Fatty acid desaturase n=1 Tax=Caldimonas brevitalea TaxID=413882 RepID=A0A0G3BUF4_9BURK|nr:acyl-CoA desaturase [Caldimonas brevitalea]AKJ30165.1 fatty acid desaturase [Caldimonas brevitalea]